MEPVLTTSARYLAVHVGEQVHVYDESGQHVSHLEKDLQGYADVGDFRRLFSHG